MSRTRLAALALAAVALTGGVTWAVTGGPEPAGIRTTSVAARGALPSAVPTGPTPGSTASSAGPGPAGAASAAGTGGRRPEKAAAGQPAAGAPAKPGRRATPAPFVQSFAAQPGAARQKPKSRPKAPVEVASAVDGCDRAYGTIAHCVPVRFPAGVTDKCAWLRDHGFKDLKVTGRDRQGLDPDRNGIACDK